MVLIKAVCKDLCVYMMTWLWIRIYWLITLLSFNLLIQIAPSHPPLHCSLSFSSRFETNGMSSHHSNLLIYHAIIISLTRSLLRTLLILLITRSSTAYELPLQWVAFFNLYCTFVFISQGIIVESSSVENAIQESLYNSYPCAFCHFSRT